MNFAHLKADRLDLNLLRVFEAVFEAQHLTRAAEMLALSPSAVSHALGRLRDHMADPLFVRQGHAMMPTPVCRRLAPSLFEHMVRLRQLLQQWTEFVPDQTKRIFRIGMPEGIEVTLLPAVQQEFFRQAPHASLVINGFDRGSLSRLLSAGQMDVAIDVALPIGEPVFHQPLLRNGYCVVARLGHSLEGPITLKQYLAARHIAVSGRATGTVLEDATLLRRGLQRQVSLRCQNYNSALKIVASSDLLLTIPTHLSQHTDMQDRLQRWVPPFQLPNVSISLYWLGSNDADEATKWLRSVVVGVVHSQWANSPALNMVS
jgi:DNA-binding transcriptional LysR family regulator